jgi:hypothetical protein
VCVSVVTESVTLQSSFERDVTIRFSLESQLGLRGLLVDMLNTGLGYAITLVFE